MFFGASLTSIGAVFFFFIKLSQEMTTAQRPLERPHTDRKSSHKAKEFVDLVPRVLRICVHAFREISFLVNGFY